MNKRMMQHARQMLLRPPHRLRHAVVSAGLKHEEDPATFLANQKSVDTSKKLQATLQELAVAEQEIKMAEKTVKNAEQTIVENYKRCIFF